MPFEEMWDRDGTVQDFLCPGCPWTDDILSFSIWPSHGPLHN